MDLLRCTGVAFLVLGVAAVFATLRNGFPPVISVSLLGLGILLLGTGEWWTWKARRKR